ncbi:subtilisin-like protein [Acephala macrosclerotiorum]|nr:subtilisin-like protein [Acephala macrosclerotiorum]
MADSFIINSYTLNTTSQTEGGKYFSHDASQSNYILLQFRAPISNDQYQVLDPLQVQVLQYFHPNTYVCRYEPTDLDIIRALPFVLSASIFHQDIVVHKNLNSKIRRESILEHEPQTAGATPIEGDSRPETLAPGTESPSQQKFEVDIILHRNSGRTVADIKQQLSNLSHQHLEQIHSSDHVIRMEVEGQYLDTIAAIDEVQSILEVTKLVAYNNIARRDLNIPNLPGTIGRVLDRSRFRGLDQNNLDGCGQIVAVADTGFDAGLQLNGRVLVVPHRDMFQDRVTNIRQVPDTVRLGDATAKTIDTYGHGTFVCRNVAARGKSSGFGLMRTTIKGTAPRASLFVQTLSPPNSVEMPVASYEKLFSKAYKLGARIHNNSYGPGAPGNAYDGNSEAIDAYLSRANDPRPDLLVVFSAGNNGENTMPAGVPAVAGQTISGGPYAKNVHQGV